MQQNLSLMGSLGCGFSAHLEALLAGGHNPQPEAPVVPQEDALARGSTNAASDPTLRLAGDGCGTQRAAGAGATVGVPSHAEEAGCGQQEHSGLKEDPQAVSPAVPDNTVGSASPQDGESATKQAIADSGQLFGSQASAATRACGADGCGSIDNSILFVGGSINHAPLLSNAPSPPPCQPAGSDKASEAAAGSGCGSGSGSGIGSGSGSRSELQHSEQGVSTPLQMSSESDNPSLSGNDRERLKRRLANRESAQRVRQRRRLEFDAMQNKLASMVGDTQRLVARITAAEAARDATAQQLQALQSQMDAEHAACAQLQAQAQGGAANVNTAASAVSAGTALGGDVAPPQGGLPLQPGGVNAGNLGSVMGPTLPMPQGVPVNWPFPANTVAPPAALGGAEFAQGAAGGFAAFPEFGSQWQVPPLCIGPLTTGMPGQRGLPPPSVRIRTQPHCCIVSSGFAPAGKAAHPGASAATASALAPNPNPHPRSQRLRQRAQHTAANATSPAAASAHARLAAQLAHAKQPQLQRPQQLFQQQGQQPQQAHTQGQNAAQAAAPAGARGGAGAAAAAALMPAPSPQSAASAAAAGPMPAASVPAASPFAAYSLLPFADE